MKWSLAVCTTLALLLSMGDATLAIHRAGVANCNACHTMHASQDGGLIDPDAPGGAPMLLKNTNVTDLCLSCHAANFGAVMGATPTNPSPQRGGGNFIFLLEDNINDAPDGALNPIAGHAAGHNVVSVMYGISADPLNNTAPGGTYPSSELTCISCHDHHGNDNYRMLRGRGTEPVAGYNFQFPAPEGEGIDLVLGSETRTNHTAYRSGWSEWCANCHGMYHREHSSGSFEHPVNRNLGGDERDSYNAYNGAVNPTGGDIATAYLPALPFDNADMTISSTSGPTAASFLSCMTCHRAHATSAPHSTRWDPNIAALGDDGFVSKSYLMPLPYPDPFEPPLCVKCHYEASTEHGQGQACMDCHRDL